ncbi:porin family protein [Salinimicrobium oceani]|uniref:PorT family protein n=1 Tax=Salinimicrobium oceani TaxID=2722702 RepID=A0ABX1D0E1_9FLAO|nr:porin family protein [Salinimicrobium oceani]NJW52629.1 PorT family protein [Salinimicrobium oceani]
MKKVLLFAFVALFACTITAQQVNFGAKAGVNFASIGGDETEEWDGKTGFHLGLISEILLSEKFAFQPEILYSSQGAKAEGTETFEGITASYEAKLKLDYVNIPLLAKYYISPNFNIHVGPQLGFLVKSEGEAEYSFMGESETETEDLKDDTKGVDFALAAGLGYKLEMGLFFEARYNLGLSNIWDYEDEDDFSQKNNVIQLSVGFMF